MCITMHVWRSDDNFEERVPSFHIYLVSGESNQVYQAFMTRAFTLSHLPILCSLVSQLLVSALGSRFYQHLFL